MSIFRGQYYDLTPANHVFVSNHPAMLYAGLSSFNLNTVGQFIQDPLLQQNIVRGFKKFNIPIQTPFEDPNGYNLLLNIINTLDLGEGNPSFDYEGYVNKKFTQQSIMFSSLIDKILWYEDEYLPDPEGYEEDNPGGFKANIKVIDGIKLCKKGFLELQRPPKEDDEWGEGGMDTIYFRCYIGSKGEFDSVRTIIDKHPPTFVAPPRRVTGGSYDMDQTDGSNIGEYVDRPSSDEIPDSSQVAAPLGRISYNTALGCHDIQNQITAVLLEDCDPASIPTPDVDNIDNELSTSFYDSENPIYQGDFTTCEAMPLSVEKGNPYIYGPNFIKCSDGTSVEKIIATNRSPKEFKKGQRVICHYIDNEWIMQEMGQPVPREPTPTAVGRWTFAKYIANINQYFLPEDYDAQQDDGTNTYVNDFTGNYLPMRTDAIEDVLNWQFWNRHGENYPWMKRTVTQALDGRPTQDWGTDPSKWKLNTGIIQTSIFDQYKLGGLYDAGLTNPGGAMDVPYPEIAPLFFGPVFAEGVKKRIIPPDTEVKTVKHGPYGVFDEEEDTPYSIPVDAEPVNGDLKARRSVHIPAEVAINGPYKDFASPVESYHAMATGINNADYSFLHFNEHYNYQYWTDAEGEDQSFALPPVNPGKVYFMALSQQFACADDIYAIDSNMLSNFQYLAFRSQALEIERLNTVGLTGSPSRQNLISTYKKCVAGLGDALTRGNPDVQKAPPAPLRRNKYDQTGLGSALAAGGDQLCPKYDNYVDIRNSEDPTSGRNATRINSPSPIWIGSDSDLDNNAGGELVGIISARNKIVRQGGGEIKITSIFNFGQGSTKTVSSYNAEFQWLGGAAFNITPGGNTSTDTAAWGNQGDEVSAFGTMNLHVKAYDYWPEDQTVFIGPYFTVLHFNPGNPDELITGDHWLDYEYKYFLQKKDKDTGKLYLDYSAEGSKESFNEHGYAVEVTIDSMEHYTDYRVPTFGPDPESPIDRDGQEVGSLFPKISARSKLRPEKYWNVDYGRRGALLTGNNLSDEFGTYGGFIYGRKVIGLDKDTYRIFKEGEEDEFETGTKIVNKGSGFSVGEKYEVGNKGAVIEITEVDDDGGVVDFDFPETTNQNLINNEKTHKLRGEGYLPSDFPQNIIFSTGFADGGVSCEIIFNEGFAYRKYEIDECPRLQMPARKINPAGSQEGKNTMTGAETYSISLSDNSEYAMYPGQYELFFHFQNDISFVSETRSPFVNNNAQFIAVDIV